MVRYDLVLGAPLFRTVKMQEEEDAHFRWKFMIAELIWQVILFLFPESQGDFLYQDSLTMTKHVNIKGNFKRKQIKDVDFRLKDAT